MLFNTPQFLFVFLPLTVAGFLVLARWFGSAAAKVWLIGASLVFYGWWNVAFLPILLFSITANWILVATLMAGRARGAAPGRQQALLVAGLALNLGMLGYFKYTHFFLETSNQFLGTSWDVAAILLPLGISFYTFQKIALLVDVHSNKVEKLFFMDYCLFVTFFPQLIAGPIVHHAEVMPQFSRPEAFRFRADDFASGITLFLVGLFKKVVVADALSGRVDTIYHAAQAGQALSFADAWGGGLLFSLQLYFDFSAYSDMAVGLGLLFGVRLPFNFASPYKAANVIDFWNRWHISLTRFLTAYIYNPIVVRTGRRRMLAGKPLMKKKGTTAGAFLWLMAVPIMITMTLAGLWHGAGWQFVAYGVLFGCYLVINHTWRLVRQKQGWTHLPAWTVVPSVLLTFAAVTVALSIFRAPDLTTAWVLVQGQLGLAGFAPPSLFVGIKLLAWVAGLLAWCWFAPSSQEWVGLEGHGVAVPERRPRLAWAPDTKWAVLVGAAATYAIMSLGDPSAFLYFNF